MGGKYIRYHILFTFCLVLLNPYFYIVPFKTVQTVSYCLLYEDFYENISGL